MVHNKYFLSQRYASRYILLIFLLTLISCNKNIEDKPSILTDTVVKNPPTVISLKDEKEKIVIDSLKMHAIDNLYFGLNPGTNSGAYIIDNVQYSIVMSKGVQNKGVSYYLLKSNGKITTRKKAQRIINNLKKIISKKHNGVIALNKTYYTKHPEENTKRQSSFERRTTGEYDEKIINQPYEVAAYRWDLKYKTIQIGYFIDNKNKTLYMENRPQYDYYTIYIELTSNVIKPLVVEKKSTDSDSDKF